ncbi:hypothetical protein H4582DRAFT_2069240 [Lactarius indigo]|nr:hypothetical protein H4582DRAFT_2069240 [Lactarius indigo]
MPIHKVGTTAESVPLSNHSTAMKAPLSKQPCTPSEKKLPLWEEPGTPPLESIAGGSSDEWEGASESELESESEEDSDADDVKGDELTLTEDQADMLQKHVAEFQAADLHRRLAIIKECLNWIQARWQPKASFKKKQVKTLVRQYLYNKGRRAKKKSTLNLGKRWTYLDVVMDAHHEELHIMTLSLSDSKGGSPGYLGCYRKALKTVEEGLSEETKAQYRAQAKSGQKTSHLPWQQRRMMERHGMSTFREFAQYVYSQYGVRVAILAAYRDGEGDPAITFFDINEKLGATSFKKRHENWQNEGMGEDFATWATECFGKGSSDSDEEDRKKSKDAAPEIKLKTDSQGYPMLPSWESIKNTDLRYKKYLIGRYLSGMYRA